MLSRLLCVSVAAAILLGPAASTHAQAPLIQITADLTDAPRKLFHADVELPVQPGPLALITPEWIPGVHGPAGPVYNIVGIVFRADGKALPWSRDPVNVYEYHLTVPAGVSTLHAHLDCITTRPTRVSATLEWESLLLYPAGRPVHDIAIQPSVKLPAGWGIGTSLQPVTPFDPAHPGAGVLHFKPTTVELLEDSPVMTGAYFREYPLATDVTPKHFVDFIGYEPSDVNVRPAVIDQLSRLVHQAFAAYGPPHYTSYHFLVLFSPGRGGGGLEHHESSDNTVPRHSYDTDDSTMLIGELLCHEFTHSWNGKYRMPDGLATPDYAVPMKDNLLWIYEGLTDYMGNVLSSRIGASNPEDYRQYLALTAAVMDNTPGREWRSIEDTTFTSAMPRSGFGGAGGGAWASWRRGTDYYPEGDLVWLDADTTIRKLTGNQKSLRDFMQIFLQKGGSGVPRVLPYSLDEVTATLNQVAPYDWAGFFHQRIYEVQPHVNLEGIEQGGYKLVYTTEPTHYEKVELKRSPSLDFWFSLGLSIAADGTLNDVRMGGPGYAAGLSPEEKITAVNGRTFSAEALHAAIAAGHTDGTPIQLLVQNEDVVVPATITYRDGERYPHLVRADGTPDYLTEIASPLMH